MMYRWSLTPSSSYAAAPATRTPGGSSWSAIPATSTRSRQAFRLPQHDAEDVFQDTFTRAYERLHTLRDDDAFRPWLASLTRRLCIDRLRASRPRAADGGPDPGAGEDQIDELTDAFAVHEALAELPENCREILDRFFARDESYRTIGQALDLPPGRSPAGSRGA